MFANKNAFKKKIPLKLNKSMNDFFIPLKEIIHNTSDF